MRVGNHSSPRIGDACLDFGCTWLGDFNTQSSCELLAALRDLARSALADYKAPDRVVVLDHLPLTSMMKVDKRALADLATRETNGARTP